MRLFPEQKTLSRQQNSGEKYESLVHQLVANCVSLAFGSEKVVFNSAFTF